MNRELNSILICIITFFHRYHFCHIKKRYLHIQTQNQFCFDPLPDNIEIQVRSDSSEANEIETWILFVFSVNHTHTHIYIWTVPPYCLLKPKDVKVDDTSMCPC